ncbi:uncharacterized protein LOC121373628 [Gigantopelta aegis]|uniref:uncharacterized protein LOC121373628 n=1 Tax=Gigantopelta aegis TaxID=1735272 RepID=UPI001B887FC6|nr:uncharacterized protein LOC121373628 [Gigantopelta aegis]
MNFVVIIEFFTFWVCFSFLIFSSEFTQAQKKGEMGSRTRKKPGLHDEARQECSGKGVTVSRIRKPEEGDVKCPEGFTFLLTRSKQPRCVPPDPKYDPNVHVTTERYTKNIN